jgi:restriction modification system DNA specificity domain protein
MKVKLGDLIEEYSERNVDNKYKPVAVGKYGIRSRESIYTKELAKDYSKNKLIYKGTLTVGMGSNQIDIGILRDDEIYSVSPAYHTYKIKIPNYDYLDYLLAANNNRMFSIYANRGSRQGKTLDLKRWLTDELRLHDEKDQKIIVHTLNTVKQLISQKEAELVKLDELVKARFVEMFKGKYNSFKVDEKLKTTSGGTPKSSVSEYYDGGDIPWLTSGEVNYGDITKSSNYITEKGLNNSSAKWVPENSIVIAMYGATAGKVGIVRYKTTTNQAVCSVLPNDNFNQEFLRYAFQDISEELTSKAIGGGQPNISQTIIKNSYIVDAPIEEQERFASFAKQVDKSKFVLSNELTMCDFYIRLIHDRVMHSRINLRVAQ